MSKNFEQHTDNNRMFIDLIFKSVTTIFMAFAFFTEQRIKTVVFLTPKHPFLHKKYKDSVNIINTTWNKFSKRPCG